MILFGCANLLQGHQQPVLTKSLKEKIFFTSCSGSVETWRDCNSKAYQACPKGYTSLEKAESAVGARRELTFQCN